MLSIHQLAKMMLVTQVSSYDINYLIKNLNDSSTFNEKIKGKDYLVVVKDDPKILEYIKRNNLTKVENNTYKLH